MAMKKMTCPSCGREVKLDEMLTSGTCTGCGAVYSLGGAAPIEESRERIEIPTEEPGYLPGRPAIRGQLAPEYRARAEAEAKLAEAERLAEVERLAELRAAAAKTAAARPAPKKIAPSPASVEPLRSSFKASSFRSGYDTTEKLRQASRALHKRQWERARALLNEVLMLDPASVAAYVGRLQVRYKLSKEPDLARIGAELRGDPDYQAALRFSRGATKQRLESYAASESAEMPAEKPAEAAPAPAVLPVPIPVPVAAAPSEPAAPQPMPVEEVAPIKVKEKKKKARKSERKAEKEKEREEEKAVQAPVPMIAAFPEPRNEAELRAGEAIAETDRALTARASEYTDRTAAQKKLRSADKALARKKWSRATELYDAVLATDPECSEAYLGRMLAARQLTSERKLAGLREDLGSDVNFLLAMHYSDGALRRRLSAYADASLRARVNDERIGASLDESRRRALEQITDRKLDELSARMRLVEEREARAGIDSEKSRRERAAKVSALLDAADAKREKKNWKAAEKRYREALDIDGECSEAYIGLLLCDLRLTEEKRLARVKTDYEPNENFLLAIHFGSRATRCRLERYLAASQGRIGQLSVPTVPPAAEPAKEAPKGTSAVAPAPIIIDDSEKIRELRDDMDRRLDAIERALTGGNCASVGLLEERLAATEREATLARIGATESAIMHAGASRIERAELEARLAGAEYELKRLRGAAALGASYGAVGYRIPTQPRAGLKPLYEKAEKQLRRRKFKKASDTWREILVYDPTSWRAYLGLLLCELRITKVKKLSTYPRSYSERESFALALRFADPKTRRQLERYADRVDRAVGLKTSAKQRRDAADSMRHDEELYVLRRDNLIAAATRRTEACRTAGTLMEQPKREAKLLRAERLLRRRKFAQAEAELNELIKFAPNFAGAYVARLLAVLRCRSLKKLKKQENDFRDCPDFILAVYFGRRSTRRRLLRYSEMAAKRNGTLEMQHAEKWSAIEEREGRDLSARQRELNRAAGDRAEAQRTAIDLTAAKTATASVRLKSKKNERRLSKGYRYLAREKWQKAERCFEAVRAADPANADAHIGMLLISLGLTSQKKLIKARESFRTNRFYILAVCCADPKTRQSLADACERVEKRVGKAPAENSDISAVELAKRRERLVEARLAKSEEERRWLEAEFERLSRSHKEYEILENDFLYDSEPTDRLKKPRFGFLRVLLFLVGMIALAAVSVGIAILFTQYGGNFSEMIAAFKK